MRRKYTVLGSGLLALGFLVWIFPASIPMAVVDILSQLQGRAVAGKALTIAMAGVTELLYLAPLIVYLAVTKTSVKALIGNRTSGAQWALAALLGVLLSLALTGLDSVMQELFTLLGAQMPDQSALIPDTWGTLAVGVVAIGVCAGVAEEPVFRGVVQRGIASASGKRSAIVLTALLFSLFHFDVVGFPTRFLIGLALGAMLWRCGSILPGVFAHAAFNITAIALPLALNAVLPGWNGFDLIKSASSDVNGMLTWVLLSIPFVPAAFGVYRLFAWATPASAAWKDEPYARSSVKPAHSLAWVAVGLGVAGMTALTTLSMWLYKFQDILGQLTKYTR